MAMTSQLYIIEFLIS